jgi:hypothetical protein
MHQISMRLLPLVTVGTYVSAQLSGVAQTTRYWDSCLSSCAWDDKADFKSLLQSVIKSGAVATDKYGPSGCQSTAPNARFVDPKQQPMIVNDNLSLGYAAVGKLNGLGERELCCTCIELTFTSGPVNGKRMVVQVTGLGLGLGGDLNANHFDLQIPGGGVGIFTQGVQNQFGTTYNWGNPYGGLTSMEQCNGLPAVLHPGCRWRFDWFHNADNPSVNFRQVQCPSRLTETSKCVRADAAEQQKLPVAPNTTPSSSTSSAGTTPPATCPNKQGSQCGGKAFTGNTCCPSGLQCVYVEPYWSNCQPATSKQVAGGAAVATAPVSQPATSNTQQQCSNAKWAQCAGKAFKGEKCCPSGSMCKYINEWYSQCL